MDAPAIAWGAPPPAPELAGGEVHLWRRPLPRRDAATDDFFELLSPDERARARRYFFAKNRRQFIAGRGWLRIVLAHYLCVDPAEFAFRRGAFGKPYAVVPTGASALDFNLAHADSLALVAVLRGGAVGVDVESVRSVPDSGGVAVRVFSARERRWWRAGPPGSSMERFFRLWTAKEACVKAMGTGLDDGLADIEIVGHEGELARRVFVTDGTGRRTCCRMVYFEPAEDYIGAVAIVDGGADRP